MDLKSLIFDRMNHFDVKGIEKKDIDRLDINEACDLIDELDEIYDGRYKYDLNYAYSNAHKRITGFYDGFMEEFELEKQKYKSSDSEHHHISIFVDRLYKHVSKLHINYKKLNATISIVSLLLSLGLILSIHWITDHFVSRFEALIDSFVIVIVLGTAKLFLEERFIREKVEQRGWMVYKKNIDLTKNNFAKVILSYLLLKKANETGLLLYDIVGQHEKLLHALHSHADFE